MAAEAKSGKNLECNSLPLREKWFVAVENPEYLVVAKGSGLPSAPLKNGGLSVFEEVSTSYSDILSVHGKKEGEGGLIHRIDTETCGLILIARNDDFFSHIDECRNQGLFCKRYTAYSLSIDKKRQSETQENHKKITGNKDRTLPEKGVITSRFRSFGKKGLSVKPVFNEMAGMADRKKAGLRLYTTEIIDSEIICRQKNMNLIRIVCEIKEGFRHQVRAHLAYSGFPVFGDAIYNKQSFFYGQPGVKDMIDFSPSVSDMLFFASGLLFTDNDGSPVSVSIPTALMDEKAIRTFEKSLPNCN